MRTRWIVALVSACVALATVACAPRIGPEDGATGTVVLPSMERCLHAGFGATLAIDGDRLSWTCESPVGAPRGLLGEPTVDGVDVAWRLVATERNAAGAFVVTDDSRVQGRATLLMLASGEACGLAPSDSPAAASGLGVTYSCTGDVVVVGDLIGDADGIVAVRGTLRTTAGVMRVVDPRPVRVDAVTLQ